jgi:hypothetical protein
VCTVYHKKSFIISESGCSDCPIYVFGAIFNQLIPFQSSPTRELRSQPNVVPGCLSSEGIKRKGDFVLQTGHVIEIVTKLFLVVQNATGKPPHVNIATEFEANFGAGSVMFSFKRSNYPANNSAAASSSAAAAAAASATSISPAGGQEHQHEHHHASTHVKLVKRGNKMDIFL